MKNRLRNIDRKNSTIYVLTLLLCLVFTLVLFQHFRISDSKKFNEEYLNETVQLIRNEFDLSNSILKSSIEENTLSSSDLNNLNNHFHNLYRQFQILHSFSEHQGKHYGLSFEESAYNTFGIVGNFFARKGAQNQKGIEFLNQNEDVITKLKMLHKMLNDFEETLNKEKDKIEYLSALSDLINEYYESHFRYHMF